MIKRTLKAILEKRLAIFPAAGILGPRQAGKTTLARSLKGRYFDLEIETDRLKLDTQWNDLVTGRELIILDEAQSQPEIFPRIRAAIDADRKRNGRFLLLGSVSPFLLGHVSEALTGRLSLVELTPLLLQELTNVPVRTHWLYGGFPDGGILSPESFPQWQTDYINLLSQRDLPNWGMHATPQTINRLLRMLIPCNGQLWNASQLGRSLGLSHNTVNTYADFLEGAFIIRRLPPFHANIRKRLTRSPKLFWRDSGLLHALGGVTCEEDLLNQPWAGSSWEGYVIEQILSTLTLANTQSEAFFFRTSDGYQADLVLKMKKEIWALEIKMTSSPSEGDMHRLQKAGELINADLCILVSHTNDSFRSGKLASWSLQHLLQQICP